MAGTRRIPKTQSWLGPSYHWVLGASQVLPGLSTSPTKSPPGHPSLCNGLFFHWLSNGTHPTKTTSPRKLSFFPSLALLGPPITYVRGLWWRSILSHQPSPPGVLLVSGILRKTFFKRFPWSNHFGKHQMVYFLQDLLEPLILLKRILNLPHGGAMNFPISALICPLNP